MKLTAEELNKTINDMSTLCSDGKKDVRKLVAKITGVDLSPKKQPLRSGQIWCRGSTPYMVCTVAQNQYTLIDLLYGNRWSEPTSLEDLSIMSHTFTAECLTEYLETHTC